MPIDPTALWRQVQLGEDSELELKEVRLRGTRVVAPRRDSLADELAAFANADGGRVVLGVADNREPKPLDADALDAVTALVGEICTDSIDPALDFVARRVPAPTGQAGGVLVVDIEPGIDVHRSPGGYLRRRGDAKRTMTSADIRRLLQARGQSDATGTDTRTVAGTGVNTLQADLWERYASSRRDEPPATTLAKLKFIKSQQGTQNATVAGVLLATDDPRDWLPNAYIQAVCYAGDRMDGDQQIDAQDITGPLDEQIRQAVRFVARNRRVAARKLPARQEVPQFSERGGAPRLRGDRLAHPPVPVQRPAGTLLARRAVQLDDPGRPAHEPVHAQRTLGIAPGPVPGWRRDGFRRQAVFHRTPW